MKKMHGASIVATGLAAAVMLAGCGAPAGETAQAIAGATAPQAVPSATDRQADEGLFYKDTQVCIVNNTGRTIKGFNYEGSASPGGGRFCMKNSNAGGDVSDSISSPQPHDEYVSNLLFNFTANNPVVGTPWMNINGAEDTYEEGQSRDFSNGVMCHWSSATPTVDFTVKRENDGSYKKWTITIHSLGPC